MVKAGTAEHLRFTAKLFQRIHRSLLLDSSVVDVNVKKRRAGGRRIEDWLPSEALAALLIGLQITELAAAHHLGVGAAGRVCTASTGHRHES